jgi:D-alanine-D-alanine ligase
MKIGLTYDLRSEYLAMGYSEDETAEFDRDDTIIAIENALKTLGHKTDRIGNAKTLTGRLVAGDRWDLVFNIAEGLFGVAREAQVPAILDLYEMPYTFSDPLIMGLTLHKGMTKQVIRESGFATPDFKVVATAADAAGLKFGPPYFVKPVAEGTGKGISEKSIVRDQSQLAAVCNELLKQYRQPVLVETYLSGREFTVGIAGTGPAAEVLGTMEVILLPAAEKGVYSYINKEKCEDLVEYRLVSPAADMSVKKAEALALGCWRALGCRDSGRIDIRCDESGTPYFLEVNPLAGLHPEHSDLPILCNHLGIPYVELIRRIVDSAALRMMPEHRGQWIQ